MANVFKPKPPGYHSSLQWLFAHNSFFVTNEAEETYKEVWKKVNKILCVVKENV